jgi:hypothetical protein
MRSLCRSAALSDPVPPNLHSAGIGQNPLSPAGKGQGEGARLSRKNARTQCPLTPTLSPQGRGSHAEQPLNVDTA